METTIQGLGFRIWDVGFRVYFGVSSLRLNIGKRGACIILGLLGIPECLLVKD